jgi:hypothetical protein
MANAVKTRAQRRLTQAELDAFLRPTHARFRRAG